MSDTNANERQHELRGAGKFPRDLLEARLGLLPESTSLFRRSIEASGILREPEQQTPERVTEAADTLPVESSVIAHSTDANMSIDPETIPIDADEARRAVEDARNAA